MKILQILEATLGGTARHVVDLSLGLRRAGHDVHLVYNPREGRIDAIFRGGLPLLERAGVVLVPLEMSRSVGPADVRVIAAIRRYLRRYGPFDIIHGHSSKGGAYARIAGIGLPGARIYTPNAFITTNPELRAASRFAYGLFERLLARPGHAVIAVSEEERDEALRLGNRNVLLVPNGADVTSPALSRQEVGLPDDALIIGAVGRLVPQKSPENLIRAFALLAPRFPNVRLAIVGTGPLELAAKAEAEKVGERVHWLGAMDGPSVMPAFDVYALPSLYEGFPYVLIEAASLGLPIVTTAVGGASMIVDDNGLIVPPARPDLFAQALEKLIADAELRRRMSTRSRAIAERFTVAKMIEGVLRAYELSRSRDRA